MTELYCDANDAFDLLQLQASAYPNPGSLPDPIWQSLDLEERRMPVLDQWLLTVRNGTLPSDPQEAQKQNNAWASLQALDTYFRNVYAEINKDTSLYNGATGNPTAQQNILVTALETVAVMLNGTNQNPNAPQGVPDPFSILNANLDQFACWLVAGYQNGTTVNVCPADNPSLGIVGPQYITSVLIPTYHPQMGSLMENFNSIYNPVQTQISLQFAQTITQDPTPVLAAALEPVTDNLSPDQVLKALLTFLNQDLATDDGTNPQKVQLLKDTIAMVQKGLSTIEDISTTSADAKIRTLFDTFHLENGISYFDNRVGDFVQWDLQERMRKGEFPTNITDILKVSGGDIRTRLLESGVTNLDSVSADLNNSRTITTSNINVFRSYFEPSFEICTSPFRRGFEIRGAANRPKSPFRTDARASLHPAAGNRTELARKRLVGYLLQSFPEQYLS